MTRRQAAALLPALARQALAGAGTRSCCPRRNGRRCRTACAAPRGEPVRPARRSPVRHRRAAHPGRPPARRRTGAGAPRLDPATAARLLGADQAQLEAQLQAHAASPGAISQHTGSGLRLDQAAAAYLVLTSSRRAEVMAGPAGSGKTRTVAEMARIWREAGMGEVIGLATSQTACNVLAEAGVPRAYNTARFLGHLHGQREALGPLAGPARVAADPRRGQHDVAGRHGRDPRPGPRHDCKVVVTGDHEQLAAVEGGGGMMLLARRQGYVQLAEPQRFTHAWERDATLRLRAGDVTVLAAYEEHGRLRGGTPEEATEQAYRGWLADYLNGTDTLLMARTEDQARELSRRARDDLIRYGVVAQPASPSASPQGQQASAGDLVIARRNTRAIQAGDHDRELANRDVLQIISTTAGPGGTRVEVRRLTGRDPATGQASWSAPFQVPRRYLATARHPRLRDHPARRARPHHRAPPTSWSTASATGRACTSR